MAMIKCKECGKEISDKAKACPNCGAKYESEDTKTMRVVIGSLILIISLFVFFSGISGIQNTTNKNTTTTKTTSKSKNNNSIVIQLYP